MTCAKIDGTARKDMAANGSCSGSRPPNIGPILTLAGTTCWPFLSKNRTLARNPYSPLHGFTCNTGLIAPAANSNEIPKI